MKRTKLSLLADDNISLYGSEESIGKLSEQKSRKAANSK